MLFPALLQRSPKPRVVVSSAVSAGITIHDFVAFPSDISEGAASDVARSRSQYTLAFTADA
jgi:hypothetical protein